MKFSPQNVPAVFSLEKKLRPFDDEIIRTLTALISNLRAIFDRRVGVSDNLDVVEVSYSSNGSANTEDAVAHLLGRIPVGFIVTSRDKAGIVYASGTAFTKTNLYLKVSVTTVAVKLLVF